MAPVTIDGVTAPTHHGLVGALLRAEARYPKIGQVRRKVRPYPTDFRIDRATATAAIADRGPMAAAFAAHEGRLVDKWLHYLDAYDQHMHEYRGSDVKLLEMGVFHGGSLDLWRTYLGERATIVGVDIDPRSAMASTPDHPVRTGSQADPDFLRSVVGDMGGIDVVVDDGSHVAVHQRVSFDVLFPLLADGGLYIVEDVHTAYWRRTYGGGYRRRASFIEFAKDLVDGMHSWYYWRPPPRRARFAATSIESICFHDSMVFIRKRVHGRPANTPVGSPSW